MNAGSLRPLRGAVLLLAALLAVGAGLLQLMWARIGDAQQRLAREIAHSRAAQAQLQSSGEEREIIVRHLAAYRELERSGFMAPEQRIHWVTGLREANEAAGLFGIEYQIGAQRAHQAAQHLGAPLIEVLESPMRIKAGLLHEEDLVRLIRRLEAQNLGLFLLEACTLKRLATAPALAYQVHLEADCHMTWLTAHARKAGAPR